MKTGKVGLGRLCLSFVLALVMLSAVQAEQMRYNKQQKDHE
jgi:hypothetical protein